MVPVQVQPDNGVHRLGEAIFVKFTTDVCALLLLVVSHELQVNCDKPYWFDVRIVLDSTRTLAAGSEFMVFCQDDSLYIEIGGDNVCI